MKTKMSVTIHVVATAMASWALVGCEASDAAYFNVAVQCQSAYPNDSWAQQQCLNRGSAAIQQYEHQHRCDNAAWEYDNELVKFNGFVQQTDRNREALYQDVVNFRTAFTNCVRRDSLQQCMVSQRDAMFSRIEAAHQTLTEQEQWDYDLANMQAQLRAQCSNFYTFAGIYQVNTHYDENRSALYQWRSHVHATARDIQRRIP